MNRRFLLQNVGSGLILSFVPWLGAQAKDRKLLGYIRTNWSRDPYAYGSYSYVAKGARRGDIRALAEPIDEKIFFAGEAVFPKRNSTVHAAYESGQHAADLILRGRAHRIAVIGAGMSGLAAAHKLSKQGREVTVFEARDRIGGRVWTDQRLGIPLELGASWVHGTNGNPLMELADGLGLQHIRTQEDSIIRGRGGRKISESDAPEWLEEVAEIQHSAGANGDQISRWGYFFVNDYGGPDVKFPNGYAEIFKALRGDYKIHLKTQVMQIQTTDRRVVLGFDPDRRQAFDAVFDAVVVTVPLGVLKRGDIRFEPKLPEKKQKAINRLGMGTLDKVYGYRLKPGQ